MTCIMDDILRSLGIRDIAIPPMRLVRVSPYKSFREAGQEWKNKLVSVGGLRQDHKILDIGCGSGRVSLALMDWLSDVGTYDGIDIRPDEVEWLSNNYSTKRKNFTFHHADIYNRFYHPSGTIQACDYIFPFEDECFDFIFLTSVFTHLLPIELEHYVKEMKRMTKANGTVLPVSS